MLLLCAMVLTAVAAKAQPVITQQPTNQIVLAGSVVSLSVSVSGSGPFSYLWQFHGTNLSLNENGIITTVAGNGYIPDPYGDGGAATNAALLQPIGVAVDGGGNLFITDYQRIRKVATNGIITTVAGNGYVAGANGIIPSGDGGAATNAALNFPQGVAVDGSGNLFIADYGNSVIRKVATNGIITTVAGNGTNGYSGDNGAATMAELNYPQGVAVDGSGNLFIADSFNGAIRKVATNGIITSVAGGLSPFGLAVDGSGNLFIVDRGNQRICKLATNGIITMVAGNGTNGYSGDGSAATNAELSFPWGVAVDGSGNLFIASQIDNRIRKVTTNGIITTVAGNGTGGYSGDGGAATNASLNSPVAVAVDGSGNLFIGDSANKCIRKVGGIYDIINLNDFPTLVVGNVSNANSGNYSVVITNFSGSATSSVAALTVVPSLIIQQPQNQLSVLGSTVAFSVGVSSMAPVAYQWYLSNLVTAGATAQMLSGFVYGATVTNGGAGYTITPRVQFIGGGGSGAIGNASITNGQVTTITMTNAGSGYTSSPSILIDPPTGLLVGQTNATLNLSAITTNKAGGYYVIITNIYGSITSSVANLTIAYPPSISQQPQNQTVGDGSGANFNVTAAGTSPFSYQWWMVSGQQSNATAVPFVINGFVLAANMTSGGAGYLTVPSAQFVGGSGSGANGTAVVSNRMVTAINMGSAGSGYTTPPTIQIAAPTAISLTGQTNNILALLAVANTNAGNYYVVVTNNFGSVTSSFASLIVAPAGYNQISGQHLSSGKLSLSFVGLQGTNYALDRSFNLSPANWIPQVTNPADANGNLIFTNTPDPTTNNFWRIRSVP